MIVDPAIWSTLTPTASRHAQAHELLLECAAALEELNAPSDLSVLESARHRFGVRTDGLPATVALEALITMSVLCDLKQQGWGVRNRAGVIDVAAPQAITASVDERKAQVRAGHLIERDAQLRNAPIRRFILQMERRRLFGGEWRSIFSLMRDGRELASALRRVRSVSDLAEQQRALASVVDPYVQIVESEAQCGFTGLRLADIWRYFRHTWSTANQSAPGRKLFFLVRDRAAPCHPVIGIGALGSSIVQLRCRDRWIGWTPSEFVRELRTDPTTGAARWLSRSLTELLAGIFVGDFVKQGILRTRDLGRPSADLIRRLAQLGRRERAHHRLYPGRNRHKAGASAADWAGLAQTSLFRAKRALALAELLAARRALQYAGFTRATKRNLARALADRQAVAAIGTILRRVKAANAGVKMMDITVCGAVAPYSTVLGGKLVGLLAASPAVTQAYERRYRSAPSIIASSLGGRAVVRKPRLVLLGTTSLYDAATSQYNRLRMPAGVAGGPDSQTLSFIPLGRTVGYGSFHFSRQTMEAFETLLAQRQKGRQVNSIFGEGVNPKLRKVREALDAVGMPSDLLLQHGSPRLVFAVPLATNFREILLGLDKRPQPIVPQTEGATQAVIDFWRTRWLARRILRDEALHQVSEQSLMYPVRHGARVRLPPIPGEDGPLFGDDPAPSALSANHLPTAHRALGTAKGLAAASNG